MSAPSELRLSNRQRLRPLDSRALRRLLVQLLEGPLEVPRYALGVHIVRAAPMSRLNARFLAHSGPTDVITFDHGPYSTPADHPPGTRETRRPAGSAPKVLHGEIYICIDVAIEQAHAFATTWQDEVMRYAIHGLLHLLGHDDQARSARVRMKRLEGAMVRLARGFADARAFGAMPKPAAALDAAVRISPGRRRRQRRASAPQPRPRR